MFKERVRLVTLTHKSSGEKIKINPKKVRIVSPAPEGGSEICFAADLNRIVQEDPHTVERMFHYCHPDLKK